MGGQARPLWSDRPAEEAGFITDMLLCRLKNHFGLI